MSNMTAAVLDLSARRLSSMSLSQMPPSAEQRGAPATHTSKKRCPGRRPIGTTKADLCIYSQNGFCDRRHAVSRSQDRHDEACGTKMRKYNEPKSRLAQTRAAVGGASVLAMSRTLSVSAGVARLAATAGRPVS